LLDKSRARVTFTQQDILIIKRNKSRDWNYCVSNKISCPFVRLQIISSRDQLHTCQRNAVVAMAIVLGN